MERKHIRFEFEDIDDYEDEESPGTTDYDQHQTINHNVENERSKAEKVSTDSHSVVIVKPLSSSIVSTLSLFGVQQETESETSDEEQHEHEQSPGKRKRSILPSTAPSDPKNSELIRADESSPPKRIRRKKTSFVKNANMDMELVQAVEKDSGLIDLQRERLAALSVIKSILSVDDDDSDGDGKDVMQIIAKIRKPGLHRRLLDGNGSRPSQSVDPNNRKATLKNANVDIDIQQSNLPIIGGSTTLLEGIQRKGLYRKLSDLTKADLK